MVVRQRFVRLVVVTGPPAAPKLGTTVARSLQTLRVVQALVARTISARWGHLFRMVAVRVFRPFVQSNRPVVQRAGPRYVATACLRIATVRRVVSICKDVRTACARPGRSSVRNAMPA